MNTDHEIFKHGSTWLRADFHLHTMADKEFVYDNSNNDFIKKYIEQLKRKKIHLGVITNHNKFDKTEFKNLAKKATNESIYLLAGVEFSLKDIGVHILIVFDKSWYHNSENKDYITQFLDNAHIGKTNYFTPPYPNSNYSLTETVDELDKYQLDYFIIMAHIDDKNGMIKQLERRNLDEFLGSISFQDSVLAFQDVRHSKNVLEDKLKKKMLACVEGSDNAHAQFEGIGRKHYKSYIKLGDFSFEAVKYALIHHKERVKTEIPIPQNPYLRKIIIEQKEENLEIPLSSELNTIIGVRGGGKSTLLESIRFALDEKIENDKYKDNLIRRFVGEGNKISLEVAQQNQDLTYKIEKTLSTNIKVYDAENEEMPNLQPNSFIKVAYFGQKDLEEIGKDFNEKVIKEKLLKKELEYHENAIREVKIQINETLNKLSKTKTDLDKKANTESQIAELKEKIKKFETHNLQDLIAKELNYDKDEQQIEYVLEDLQEMTKDVLEKIQEYSLSDYTSYQSKQVENQSLFQESIPNEVQKFKKVFSNLEQQLTEDSNEYVLKALLQIKEDFSVKHQALVGEFEEKKKNIDDPDIDIERHKQNQRTLNQKQYLLQALESNEEKLKQFQVQLQEDLGKLENAYKDEFDFIKSKIDRLNDLDLSFKIEMDFEGDKESFKNELSDYCRGGNFNKETHIKKITQEYSNLREVYKDLHNKTSPLHQILNGGNLLSNFQEKFENNINMLLTYQVPNQYVFKYNNQPLEEYSIGQKATALISFVLANEDTNLFIIDQPEDDLDNFTVAKEIIERIKKLKPHTQFIFVTHNPNILVLGDSEQVIICEYKENKVQFSEIGSIDKVTIQQKAIEIMEGGKEAFEQRKNIYKIWKQKNS